MKAHLVLIAAGLAVAFTGCQMSSKIAVTSRSASQTTETTDTPAPQPITSATTTPTFAAQQCGKFESWNAEDGICQLDSQVAAASID